MKKQMNMKMDNWTKQKIIPLQGGRAVAFLGVFLFHTGLIETGPWGVSVFVILSGFLMTYNHYAEDRKLSFHEMISFSLNKIKKLYPLHVIMMLSAVVLSIEQQTIGYFLKYNFKLTIEQILANLFLIQAWIPSNLFWYSLNGVAWYLSITAFFYMIFPVILCELKKIKLKNCVLLIVVIYVFQCILGFGSKIDFFCNFNEFSKYIIYICPFFRAGDFIIGCCLSRCFCEKLIVVPCALKASLVEICIAVWIGISIYIYTYKIGFLGAEWFRYNMLFTPSSIVFIYCLANNRGIISKLLSNRLVLWIGNISAYTFLIHQMVIRYFDEILYKFNLSCGLLIRVLVTFGITVLCSQLYCIYQKN